MVSPNLYHYGIYCHARTMEAAEWYRPVKVYIRVGLTRQGHRKGPGQIPVIRAEAGVGAYPINACDTWAINLESLQVPFLCSPLAPWSKPQTCLSGCHITIIDLPAHCL